MNTATNRMKALVAGGAAFAAFGIGTLLPAQANPPAPGPNGEVGQAWDKADPKGQYDNDKNKGFTCDGNGGVGGGNPALAPICTTEAPAPPLPDFDPDDPNNPLGT